MGCFEKTDDIDGKEVVDMLLIATEVDDEVKVRVAVRGDQVVERQDASADLPPLAARLAFI